LSKQIELAKAIVVFPGTVLGLIPAAILYFTQPLYFFFGLKFPNVLLPAGIGLILGATGCFFAFQTVYLFLTAGDGTPAPWAPPKRFVVAGPYRYVRNPMILSVLSLLVTEACVFGSLAVLIWAGLFWLINTAYLARVEEPGLLKRFGRDYEEYKKSVRRWLPRAAPWKQERPGL